MSRRIIRRAVAVLLLGPALLILLFRFAPVPITPLMLIRVAEGYGLRHRWVPYERIAPAMARSVIASEDDFFCTEPLGFDFGALRGQIGVWMHGGRPLGASTITMQTARNLLLWPGRNLPRKALEAWLTPQIALLWPKRRVLEVYLNSIEFGPGIFGVEAAARAFFHEPAAALTAAEAARLAAVLPDPLRWSAARPDAYVRRRSRIIAARVGQLGMLLRCAR
ncbi:MAG TPA: monofunctional biosynthetic peptidoglycan transglycosylase [Acetobacteraceae bacterium]|nr:monofunctional biosynthetic peptidoglycan transglycosylase [Acetobacteraceae bacterium]